MSYVNNMSYANNRSYVNNKSYVNNRSYVNDLSDICRLYELYEYFYESLKITCFFVFENFGIFLLIYEDGKPKLQKRKY